MGNRLNPDDFTPQGHVYKCPIFCPRCEGMGYIIIDIPLYSPDECGRVKAFIKPCPECMIRALKEADIQPRGEWEDEDEGDEDWDV